MRLSRPSSIGFAFALSCSAVPAAVSLPRRVVVEPSRACTHPEGCICSESGCRGWYDLDAAGAPLVAQLTAEREKRCDETGGTWECTWAGHRYERGEGVAADPVKAARLYAKACQGSSGDSTSHQGCVALAALGRRYEVGQGLERNGEGALASFVGSCRALHRAEATSTSSEPGCLALARAYLRGEIVGRDLARARELFAAACSSSREGCVGLVLVDIEGGIPLAASLDVSARSWLDPEYLANACRDGAGDPVVCRALALRHRAGSRVPADPDRARLLFGRACARGDTPSCDELSRSGTAAPDEAADLWHRDLSACLDGPAPAGSAPADTPWSQCVGLRRACGGGDANSCVSLAHAVWDALGALPTPARPAAALERGLLLHEEGCARGDAQACNVAADLYGKCWGFACIHATASERTAMRQRSHTLEATACEAGGVEACLRLAERYARGNGDDIEPDKDRAKPFFKRGAALLLPKCEAGDLAVCQRLEGIYDWSLDDHTRAMDMWRRPCRDGSKTACERLEGFKDNGAFGVTITPGVRWGQPLGWSASVTAIFGEKYVSQGSSHSTLSFPGYSGRGWLLQIEPGQRALKIGLGRGMASTVITPPLTTGRALKASYLRGWADGGALRDGNDYLGAEADIAVIGLKGSIGLYKGVGRDRGMLFTWGIGLGF